VPKAEGFLTNLTAGGTAVKTKITDKEYEICSQLSKYLQTQGIFLAGVDLIAEKLIEVNVTSPTGLITVDKLYGMNLASKIASYIDQKIQL
jgi:glutathione synthase